ncbi:MAG TPA: helix-turn-helix domain-containing protein [Gaiellaceae bacterium]|nr:helix-turn-helix domain-containing protein [Gaiellaceae bacterium]
MPEPDIQALLDSAAAELQAPITLEDRDFRLLAHTDHTGVIDEVRQSMIIGRRATPEVRAWFEQWRPDGARDPFRTPADTDLGVLERWCVPVQFHGTTVGYLWILDTRGIEEAELGGTLDIAEQLGALLYRRRLASQADSDLLRLLLIPNPDNEAAASEARSLSTLTRDGPTAVIAAGPSKAEELSPATLGDLTLVVQRAAEQAGSDGVLAGLIGDIGVLLLPLRRQDNLALARRLAENVTRLGRHAVHDLDVVAAIGSTRPLARASDSFVEARRALRMIRAMPDLGPVAAWDDLGVFRALAALPSDDLEERVLDARVRQLIDDPMLAATAETFLDLAGDVQATAAQLFIHRTTLYQRLDRIAELYKLDVRRNGDHRLIAHLGFKLAHVVDIRPPDRTETA